jgi:hypothetical protein
VVDKHIKDYATSDVVGNLLFSPVVQIYNILDITDLIDYAERIHTETGRRIEFSFLLNNYPRCLDIRNLPKDIRQEAIKRLETWLSTSKYFAEDERNLATLQGIINALGDDQVNDDAEEQMQLFKQYTELLDEKRNQSLEQSAPDLYRMLKWT